GATQGALVFHSDDPDLPTSIALQGDGLTSSPSLSLLVSNNNLGGVAVGASSQSLNLATFTKRGAQPLVISSILVEATGPASTLTGVPADLATNPIPLTTRQSFTFGVQHAAGKVGPERATIDVQTNDPVQPVLHVGVDGSGLPPVVFPHWGNDYVAIEFPNLSFAPPL